MFRPFIHSALRLLSDRPLPLHHFSELTFPDLHRDKHVPQAVHRDINFPEQLIDIEASPTGS